MKKIITTGLITCLLLLTMGCSTQNFDEVDSGRSDIAEANVTSSLVNIDYNIVNSDESVINKSQDKSFRKVLLKASLDYLFAEIATSNSTADNHVVLNFSDSTFREDHPNADYKRTYVHRFLHDDDGAAIVDSKEMLVNTTENISTFIDTDILDGETYSYRVYKVFSRKSKKYIVRETSNVLTTPGVQAFNIRVSTSFNLSDFSLVSSSNISHEQVTIDMSLNFIDQSGLEFTYELSSLDTISDASGNVSVEVTENYSEYFSGDYDSLADVQYLISASTPSANYGDQSYYASNIYSFSDENGVETIVVE